MPVTSTRQAVSLSEVTKAIADLASATRDATTVTNEYFDSLTKRLDKHADGLGEQITQLENQTAEGFRDVGTALVGMSERLNRTEGKVDLMSKKLDEAIALFKGDQDDSPTQ